MPKNGSAGGHKHMLMQQQLAKFRKKWSSMRCWDVADIISYSKPKQFQSMVNWVCFKPPQSYYIIKLSCRSSLPRTTESSADSTRGEVWYFTHDLPRHLRRYMNCFGRDWWTSNECLCFKKPLPGPSTLILVEGWTWGVFFLMFFCMHYLLFARVICKGCNDLRCWNRWTPPTCHVSST